MEIHEERAEGIVTLCLRGRLDSSTSGEFEEKLGSLFDGGENRIIADLSQLEYVSSAGLRVFLVGAKRASKEEGKLSLCSMREQVKEVFDIAGFSALFPMYDSRQDALKDTKA